jgi:hypothetical protein
VGICVAESSNVHVFNNTIAGSYGYAAIQSHTSFSRISNGYPFFGNRLFNNLLYNNTSTYDIVLPAPSEFIWDNHSDYNSVYRVDSPASFYGYGGAVTGLENWKLASGQDQYSQQTHPLILNPILSNYALSAASPCIDAGTNLTGLTTIPQDLFGRARLSNGTVDIGAYEFDGAEDQTQPEITIANPNPAIPYDLDTLTGTMNANITGPLDALIISDSTTNRVVVNSAYPYSWELNISNFEVGHEYVVTLYGTNSIGSLEQETSTVTRGDIGTGAPALSITNPAPIIVDSGPALISGTNNLHVAENMWWSNQYNQTFVTGGPFTASSGTWNLTIPNPYLGQNEIHVFGTNDWGVEVSDTVLVDYGNTTNHYVSVDSPTPSYPYTTWETAARVIQTAVDAACEGDTVYVTNGVYESGFVEHETGRTRVMVDKGIRLQSVNGPQATIIKGNSESPWPPYTRCVTLDHTGADLLGFTLSEGYANGLAYGGGALILDMNLMSNCIVSACSSTWSGGGIGVWGASGKGHGLLTSSVISKNTTPWSGGGIVIQWGSNFTLENCIISNNSATTKGGGLAIDGCRRIRNCLVVDNNAGVFGGGLVLGNYSKVYNCTVESNSAARGGGVAIDAPAGLASIYNSIIYYNDPNPVVLERIHPDKPYTVEFCHTTMLPTNLTSTMGSMTNDPLYLYPYGGDYRLSSNSFCRDMGATFDWMSDSMALNQTNRILYGQPDRGCYEFDGAMQPMVEVFSPNGWVSFDESIYTPYGGRNINTINMEASFTTNGITETLPVSLIGNYDWSVEAFTLQPMVTNTITVTGRNEDGDLSEESIFVVRGGIGTGAPVIAITNAPTTVSTNSILVVNGTNNIHTAGQGSWNLHGGTFNMDSGTFSLGGVDWNISMTNLAAGRYTMEVTATNLWGIITTDSANIEVR